LWSTNPDDPKGYHWGTDLREAGKDLIILGYADRTASILDNAKIARACIRRAIAERDGDEPLVVGGFSMGGLITRYTLALMETEGEDHQTATYFSYDSPHRGGWVPISIQAFAHYMADQQTEPPPDPTKDAAAMSRMLNSPAARQMAAYHLDPDADGPGPNDPAPAPGPAPQRQAFLDELRKVGWFPKGLPDLPIKRIAVANGRADGVGLVLPTDNQTLKCTSGVLGVGLFGQDPAQQHLVANLIKKTVVPWDKTEVHANGIPALDGAPGGTLDSNRIVVNALRGASLFPSNTDFPWVCFVPTVSAADVADPETHATQRIPDDPPDGCWFHAYRCASPAGAPPTGADEEYHPHKHTLLTKELCTWITENIQVISRV